MVTVALVARRILGTQFRILLEFLYRNLATLIPRNPSKIVIFDDGGKSCQFRRSLE